MPNILVAVDGSKNAMRAIDYAVQHFGSAPVTLHLLTVEPPLDDYGMVRAYLPKPEHVKAMRARAQGLLEQAARRARGENITCTTHVAVGDVAGSIVATARRLKCSAIVMGTRGMGPLKGLILGSIASKVLNLAHVPVTLVK